MRNTTNYKRANLSGEKGGGLAKRTHQIMVILTAATLIGGCTAAPPSSSSAIPAPLTPASLPAAQTSAPPTATVPPTEEVETEPDQDNDVLMEINRMNIQIGDTVLTATLADNSSADALKEALSAGPITINMRDYGSMEKVGSLGMDLPRNDQQITTEAGDMILYQGNAFVIYYAPNSWNFTRLGKIDHVTAGELREILGSGNVTITLSLPQE